MYSRLLCEHAVMEIRWGIFCKHKPRSGRFENAKRETMNINNFIENERIIMEARP